MQKPEQSGRDRLFFRVWRRAKKLTGTYGVLRGGIGNQLFQLSTYKALADRSGRELVVDINSFSHPSQIDLRRKPEALQLGPFSQLRTFVWKNNRLILPTTFFHRLVRVASDRYTSNSAPWGIYASEKGKRTMASLEGISNFRYLDAYFGDFGVIEDIAHSIEATENALIEEAKARDFTSVDHKVEGSIHLRMGDFLQVDPARVLDKKRVCEGLAALGLPPKGKFLVFSDSPELAEEALTDSGIEVIHAPDSLSDLDSLLLMGSSRNLVCSRSTFSWWAGRMIAKSGGRVSYPKAQKAKPHSGKTPTNWVFF